MKEKTNSLLQGTINISIDEYLKLKEFYEKSCEKSDGELQSNVPIDEEMASSQLKE